MYVYILSSLLLNLPFDAKHSELQEEPLTTHK